MMESGWITGEAAPAASDLIGLHRDELDTPALLVDLDAFEQNLGEMQRIAGDRRYRPHVKTHKSPVIARLQAQAGASGVCCAKVGEAEVMADGGIDDLHVTTPVTTPEKIRRLTAIARRATVSIVVDDARNVRDLSDAASAAGARLGVLVEVDVGQRRCGVPPGSAAAELADLIAASPALAFRGLQGYQGRLQSIVSLAERREAVRRALELLTESADLVRRRGHRIAVLTGGGTGSSAIDVELGGLTELQPGSYVFMDAAYRRIEWPPDGAPAPFRCALSLLTSVVSRPSSDRVVVDAGWKSASCDAGPPVVRERGEWSFEFAGDEHGVLTRTAASADRRLELGEKLELIPSHCDTTVNLHDRFVGIRGGRVERVWPIAARGRSQ